MPWTGRSHPQFSALGLPGIDYVVFRLLTVNLGGLVRRDSGTTGAIVQHQRNRLSPRLKHALAHVGDGDAGVPDVVHYQDALFVEQVVFGELQKDGPAKGLALSRATLNQMVREYYRLRGWDPKTGIPTSRKLEGVGLNDVIPELRRHARPLETEVLKVKVYRK